MLNKKINIGFLYLILPLFFFLLINFSRETDIWFLFSHGKHILNNGFPHTEFLTIHQGFHFVMQQWLFSTLMYLIYQYLGSTGIVLIIGFINIIILFFLYKLCYLVSKNSYLSYVFASLIDILLELNYIIPRPQVITLLVLLITIYILERKDKSIYFVPLLSLIQINFHASMWPMLFIICLPYLVEYIIKKDKRVKLLITIILISILLGFLNPYGIEAMTYSFSSYGVSTINILIDEMKPISLTGEIAIVQNSILFLFLFLISLIVLILNRMNYSLHIFFLFIGLAIMSFLNLRNTSLFYLLFLPFITPKKLLQSINKEMKIICFLPLLLFLFVLFIVKVINNDYILTDNKMDIIVEYLNKDKTTNKILFNHFSDGSYLEYNGYNTYIDGRAEIFLKKNNHKSDILEEYHNVLTGNINYNKFINKYHFTHLIVYKKNNIYNYLIKNNYYQPVYQSKEIVVFKKIL